MNFNNYIDLSPLENEKFDLSLFIDDKFKFVEFNDVFSDGKKLVDNDDKLLLDLLSSASSSPVDNSDCVDQLLIDDVINSAIGVPEQQSFLAATAPEVNSLEISTTKSAKKPLSVQDRRKRNTIASVKFRNKKKLLQQQMESKLFELTSQTEEMKSSIMKLELENKYLKGLLAAKNEQSSNELLVNIRQNAISNSK